MIIGVTEFLVQARIDSATLEMWLQEQWLEPRVESGERAFTDIDVARALLIRDLMKDLGVNAEGVGVALHLLDQMHGLRHALAEALKDTPKHLGSL